MKTDGLTTPDEVLDALKADLFEQLDGVDRSLVLDPRPGEPCVWLFVGVNGVGKTTTIGKVGARQIADGHSVVMAAGDTFRAAAAEQLEQWADRVGADLVRGAEGGDPSSVIFDGVQRAAAREVPTSCWPTPRAVSTRRSTSWRSCARCDVWPTARPGT